MAENVFMGNYLGNGFIVNRSLMEKKSNEIFNQLGVQIDCRELAENLSPVQKQFVAISRAIARNVKLLIMDEPTAYLSNKDAEIIFRLVERIKGMGVTVIYISHRLYEVYKLADRITVIRDGKIITTENSCEISMGKLVRLMMGREISELYPKRHSIPGETVLHVKKLSGNGVKNISFSLRRGEILGLAGVVGAGRTAVVRMLFGADRKDDGLIELNGKNVDINSPENAVELGLAFVPENRKEQGVLLEHSITDNISLSILKQLSRHFLLDKNCEEKVVTKYIDKLNIKTCSRKQNVANLSGGNQQKVVVSKWLAACPQILIFDEPTQGIDVGTRAEIYKIMNELTEQGVSIIMVSSDIEELIGMSDRIIILREGQLVKVLNEVSNITQEQIAHLTSSGGEEDLVLCS